MCWSSRSITPSVEYPSSDDPSLARRKMHSFGHSLSTDGGYSPAECGSSGVLNRGALEGDESAQRLQDWLTLHRFSHHVATFNNFTATDILRLSRSELIQICGMPDGIRLFNALNAKSLVPRATLYVCAEGERVYTAIYLERATYRELVKKLANLFTIPMLCVHEICLQGPRGILVKVNDEVVRNFQDECLLSCSAFPSSPVSPSVGESKPFANGGSSSQPSYSLIIKVQPCTNGLFGGPSSSSGLGISSSIPVSNYSPSCSSNGGSGSHHHNHFGGAHNAESSLTFGGVAGNREGGSSSGPASLLHSHRGGAAEPRRLWCATSGSSPPSSMQNFGPPRTSVGGAREGLQTSISAPNLHPSPSASSKASGARGVPPASTSDQSSPQQSFVQSTPSQQSSAAPTRTTRSSSLSPIPPHSSSGGQQHGGVGNGSFYASPSNSQGGSVDL